MSIRRIADVPSKIVKIFEAIRPAVGARWAIQMPIGCAGPCPSWGICATMVRIAMDGGWFWMDEVGFGPRREARPPSRRLRALAAAVSIASAAAAGVAFAVTAAGAHHAMTSPPPAMQSAALPAPAIRLPSAGCPPVNAVWPNLADLPAGMRAGALPIVIDEQFSGHCSAP
jgi:hypothetical protein